MTRVLVVDDSATVLGAIGGDLRQRSVIQVVGEAKDGAEAWS